MEIDLYLGTSANRDHATDVLKRPICKSKAFIVGITKLTRETVNAVTCAKCYAKIQRLIHPAK